MTKDELILESKDETKKFIISILLLSLPLDITIILLIIFSELLSKDSPINIVLAIMTFVLGIGYSFIFIRSIKEYLNRQREIKNKILQYCFEKSLLEAKVNDDDSYVKIPYLSRYQMEIEYTFVACGITFFSLIFNASRSNSRRFWAYFYDDDLECNAFYTNVLFKVNGGYDKKTGLSNDANPSKRFLSLTKRMKEVSFIISVNKTVGLFYEQAKAQVLAKLNEEKMDRLLEDVKKQYDKCQYICDFIKGSEN